MWITLLRSTLIILVSYALAAIVASITVVTMLDLVELARNGWSDWSQLNWDGELMMIAVFITAATAFVPFVLAIGALHLIRQTGWLAHLLAGFAVSFVAQLLFFNDLMHPPSGIDGLWAILLGGAVAGLVYWALKRWLAARFAPAP